MMTSLEDRFYKDREYYRVSAEKSAINPPERETILYRETTLNPDFSSAVKSKMDDDLQALNQGLTVLDFSGKGQENALQYYQSFDQYEMSEEIFGNGEIDFSKPISPKDQAYLDRCATREALSDQKTLLKEQDQKQLQKDYQHEM